LEVIRHYLSDARVAAGDVRIVWNRRAAAGRRRHASLAIRKNWLDDGGPRLARRGPWLRVLFNPEFTRAVGFARLGGASDGSWRGAFGIAQRQIPARMAGEDDSIRSIRTARVGVRPPVQPAAEG